jgi:hypothetical protein
MYVGRSTLTRTLPMSTTPSKRLVPRPPNHSPPYNTVHSVTQFLDDVHRFMHTHIVPSSVRVLSTLHVSYSQAVVNRQFVFKDIRFRASRRQDRTGLFGEHRLVHLLIFQTATS